MANGGYSFKMDTCFVNQNYYLSKHMSYAEFE